MRPAMFVSYQNRCSWRHKATLDYRRSAAVLALLLGAPAVAWAQSVSLSGSVMNAASRKPIVGATIVLDSGIAKT
ncbi:MAG TPA: hypothetical protein VHM24_06620, partial [Gemmatimonadaceae bacterium]|nr:hypothetical protein [Gemmatimonadaceae bacterium]